MTRQISCLRGITYSRQFPPLLAGIVCLSLAGAGCTPRRTADTPVPDGDTIEVVIPERTHHPASQPIRVIDVNEEEPGQEDTDGQTSAPNAFDPRDILIDDTEAL